MKAPAVSLTTTLVDHIAKSCENKKTVLLCGCGGGYDVFAALPLYANLKNLGLHCVLVNLTFVPFTRDERSRKGVENVIKDTLWKCDVKSKSKVGDGLYFPEMYLSEFLEDTVYVIERRGVKYIRTAYEHLCKEFDVGAMVLVDGGTDSLMFGNEQDLGTPEEDFGSIAAVHSTKTDADKYLFCIGYGIDAFHGVNHNLFLENVAQLTRANSFLGNLTVLPVHEEYILFKNACEYAFERMQISIVNASILHAGKGSFGDVKFTNRTAGSKLFINPLMTLYWGFTLNGVVEANLVVKDLLSSSTMMEISSIIFKQRKSMQIRKGTPFPH